MTAERGLEGLWVLSDHAGAEGDPKIFGSARRCGWYYLLDRLSQHLVLKASSTKEEQLKRMNVQGRVENSQHTSLVPVHS